MNSRQRPAPKPPADAPQTNPHHRVLQVRNLSAGTAVIRFERKDLAFAPGQYLNVGLVDGRQVREYSVYSPSEAPFVEILVRSVPDGALSRRLVEVRVGETLHVEGPFGDFGIDAAHRNRPLLFIASGTGISPFHCFVQTYPALDYLLLHGVRTLSERYDHQEYPADRYLACVTRQAGGTFAGRVTTLLQAIAGTRRGRAAAASASGVPPPLVARPAAVARSTPAAAGALVAQLDQAITASTVCYLCGNCDMIYECYGILTELGVPPQQILTEVYF